MGVYEDMLSRRVNPTPTVIEKEGENTFSRAIKKLQKFQDQMREQEQKRLDDIKRKSDMYGTLRDSGYTPKQAFEAVEKQQFPEEQPGLSTKEKKTEAETDLYKAKAKYYRDDNKKVFGSDVSKKERVSAITALLVKYAREKLPEFEQEGESLLDKLPLGTDSRLTVAKRISQGGVKGKLRDILKDLGMTKIEFLEWARKADPELAKAAFPGLYEATK